MPRVLIVEDSLASAGYFKASLQLEGFGVQHRASNFAGLLNPDDPDWLGVDILLCDLMLPDVTGSEIIHTARTHYPHIRTVLFTAATQQTAEVAGQEATLVLLKPATHDALIAAVTGSDDGPGLAPT